MKGTEGNFNIDICQYDKLEMRTEYLCWGELFIHVVVREIERV